MNNILTIAGFDPSSGAGITKDLDVFFSLGMHGVSVPTCIVNQNPMGVTDVYPIPPEQFSQMLNTVNDGIRLDGIKIGVMLDEFHVDVLSDFISSVKDIPVVLDPIISAKNDTQLLTVNGLRVLIDSVFPKTTVITPNTEEAAIITKDRINNIDDMQKAARAMLDMGINAVVIKGGHLDGEPIDILYDGRELTKWYKKRVKRDIHGTGCTFSSALLAFLVKGQNLKNAFDSAEKYMLYSIEKSYTIADNGYYYMSSAVLPTEFKQEIYLNS